MLFLSGSSGSFSGLLTIFAFVLLQTVSAQSGDGGAADGNVPASDTSGVQQGADGPDNGSVSLSTGAAVAIAVIAALVVIAGAVTATLFFFAKKRQWTIRETMRRSTRRVTTGLKALASPITPGRGMFTPGPKATFSDQERNFSTRDAGGRHGRSRLRDQDLEKGESTRVMTELSGSGSRSGSESSASKGDRKQLPALKIPRKGDKRIEKTPETPKWTKILGRS